MAQPIVHLDKLRNIGIIAHIDAGKTTLTERILFYTKKIHRMGEVHEGAATMDFIPEEQERGITIASACVSCDWDNFAINLIDTPGHVDFGIEVERCLRVLDGAIGVFCAVGGVEPQSEAVWRQAEKFKIPKIIFINKMDRTGANFEQVLSEIRSRLKVMAVPVVIPLGEAEHFRAVIDLIRMERLEFDQNTQGREYSRIALSIEEAEFAAPWRDSLLESLADTDDGLLEKYVSGQEITEDMLFQALRRAVLSHAVCPVFAGSALRNIGVQPLLDGVCAFLPCPKDVAPAEVVELKEGLQVGKVLLQADTESPFSALVFKLYLEGGRKLSLLRVYTGKIKEGQECVNVTRGEKEKITKIFRLNADQREDLGVARAGDIVAVQGLRGVCTGDSLSAPERQLLLENITAYRPVISVALEPKNREEGEKLQDVLERFLLEDPTLKLEIDDSSGQFVVSGMGELHLEVLLDRIRREYNLEPRVGNPQVVCHETITKKAQAIGEFDRALGEQVHYGHVALQVAPRERGQGNLLRWACDREGWPEDWLRAVEEGVEDSFYSGILSGYPLQDVLVEISALKRREGVASVAGYHMAAVSAFRSALAAAGPVLLEPIMLLELFVPEAQLGAALNLLSSHAAKVDNIFERGELKNIHALAPMRELFGFSTRLRSATQGRAGMAMRFERFDIM